MYSLYSSKIIVDYNSSYTTTYPSSRELSKLDEPDMQDTTGEVRFY